MKTLIISAYTLVVNLLFLQVGFIQYMTSIKGRIMDDSKSPIDYATVSGVAGSELLYHIQVWEQERKRSTGLHAESNRIKN